MVVSALDYAGWSSHLIGGLWNEYRFNFQSRSMKANEAGISRPS